VQGAGSLGFGVWGPGKRRSMALHQKGQRLLFPKTQNPIS